MNLTSYTGIQNLAGDPFSSGSIFVQGDAPYGLVQHFDGSFSINPKSPATVVGELFLRPLIDCTARAFSTMWRCARSLDSIFTRAVTLPGAAATDLSQTIPSQANKYIHDLDISRLDTYSFQQIFMGNQKVDEDRRRIQLLNEEQLKAVFHRFFGSVSFIQHLSTSQLTILENSLTDQEITVAVNEPYNSNVKNLLSRSDRCIQKMDISRLGTLSFQQIFMGNQKVDEDRRRIQLLNEEQLKAVFHRFFGSVSFIQHLSTSQLTILANSLTDQEITVAVNKPDNNNVKNLLSRSDRCIQRMDISRLDTLSFQQIFMGNQKVDEDRRRIQLLNEGQLKAVFHRFLGSVSFIQHLSTSQLTILENSLTDQEITVAVNEPYNSNVKNLLSRSDRCIQKMDISRLGTLSFQQIFMGNQKVEEDRRRIQLLNEEQLKAVFHRFFDSVSFIQLLSTSQLTILENSLTDQEITAAANKPGNSNIKNLLTLSDRCIQKLDISRLDKHSFQQIFKNNYLHIENSRRIRLLNEEQVKAALEKFSGVVSFQHHLSPDQTKFVNTPQSETLIKQKVEAPMKPKETIPEKTATKKTIQNIRFEQEHTNDPVGEPIKQIDMKRHITFGTTYVKGNSQRDALSRLIDENHREYASVWNLKHRVVKNSLLKDRCTHKQGTVDCVSYWNKVAVLREWINKPAINPNSEEWYVLADDDMPVTNMKVDPYKAIDLLRRNVDTSIIIVRDVMLWKNNDEQLSVNTGLLFVRKDGSSKKFIEDLWKKRNTATGSKNENCLTLGTCQNQEVLHEQEAFAQLIQEDRSLLGRVITVVKPRDSYQTTLFSTEDIALNTFNREGCFRRQQDHWGSGEFSYNSDASYPDGKWREGDWMGQTAGVPVNGWWCGDYNRNLPPGPIRKDMLKQMLSKVVR